MTKERRVLLIEDSRTQAELLRSELASIGLNVIHVGSAEAALERLGSLHPDLIVVDYYLPGRNGAEFCREIKANVNTRAIPVLMLTVDDSNAGQMRGLESGADDYVSKSADPDILRARIGALLREPPAESSIVESQPQFTPARVLAIDDSPTYLYYIEGELKRERYQVDTSSDPREGLEKVSDNTYDCVLVDFEMPGLDGPQVCRRIRAMGDQTSPQIVLIVLSSHEDKEHMQQGFDAGADDYISKSADSAVLRARMNALLRRKFLVEQNRRILNELQQKELQTVRAEAAREAAEIRAIMADQLASANQELAVANRKLNRANRELEQFAYSAAHDLQEPLRMIGIYSQLLQTTYSGKLDTQADTYIGYCVEGARRMDRLIKDLLDYARAAGVEEEYPRTNVDLNAVLATVLANLEGARQESGGEITAGELPVVLAESTGIQQVLQNLVGNAIKYRRADVKPQVHLSAASHDGEWLISVSDNGIGIEPRYLDEVFGLFKRLSRNPSSGTGLGLAICRRIVENHGGRIWVESKPGEGSTFSFTLPKNVAQAAHDGHPK